MSDNYTRARTIAEANPDALAWIKEDQGGQLPEVFGLETVARAFTAGQMKGATEYGGPFWAVTAVRLLRGAASTFRTYEAHHRAKIGADGVTVAYDADAAALRKAERNAAMAKGIEDFLNDDTIPRDEIAGRALSLVQDLDALMGDSSGVAGLHQNGEVAGWDSLRRGGEFEDWLKSFDDLIEVLDPLVSATSAPNLREIDDPAAFVRTVEAAVDAGLIPGINADRLSIARVEARLDPFDGAASIPAIHDCRGQL